MNPDTPLPPLPLPSTTSTVPASTTSTVVASPPVITAINAPACPCASPTPIPTTVAVIEVPVPTYAPTLPETGAGATLGAGALVCVILGWSLIRMARR